MSDKAAILAIGSELLAGQIANTNAAWLSQQLWNLGIQVVRHLTVDDVQDDIVQALDQLSGLASIIVVTGGLGPTSDDLTRQAVAAWAGINLVYHPESWSHVTKIFQGFQMPAPESNRQQCWFPEAARVLVNRAGTANAFALDCRGKSVFVLPGPPREVDALWNDYIVSLLGRRVPLERRLRLKMWRTIGKGESHLAELVEPLVQGRGFDVAYRAHPPYVELKLRYPASLEVAAEATSKDLEQALSPWVYERDRENLAATLALALGKQKSVDIYDGATQGHLMELLGPFFRDQSLSPRQLAFNASWENHESPADYVAQICDLSDAHAVSLVLAGFDAEGNWALGLRLHGETWIKTCASPYKGPQLQARNLKAVGYLAVKEWMQMYASASH